MEWLTTSARLAAKIFEEEKDQMAIFFCFNIYNCSTLSWHLTSQLFCLFFLILFMCKNAFYSQQLHCSLKTGTM